MKRASFPPGGMRLPDEASNVPPWGDPSPRRAERHSPLGGSVFKMRRTPFPRGGSASRNVPRTVPPWVERSPARSPHRSPLGAAPREPFPPLPPQETASSPPGIHASPEEAPLWRSPGGPHLFEPRSGEFGVRASAMRVSPAGDQLGASSHHALLSFIPPPLPSLTKKKTATAAPSNSPSPSKHLRPLPSRPPPQKSSHRP